MAFLKISLSISAVFWLLIGSGFATQYMVGDDAGWSSDIDYYAWVAGKSFYPGDVLVFKYNEGDHNVVVVDKDGFDKCSTKSNNGVYATGYDTFTIEKPGEFYFICEFHCDFSDQKVQITVSSSTSATTSP